MRGEQPLREEDDAKVGSSPLRNPQFRWLLGSNLTFFVALHGQSVVRSWLAFQLTGSKLALGKVAAAVALPMLLCAPFGGVIADRVERRRLIGTGQLVILLSELVLWVLLVSGRLQFWHLLTGTVVIGVALPMILPARQALVVDLVGHAGLAQAVALSIGVMNATRVLGPLLSGPLIDLAGPPVAYGVGVTSYLASILCLAGVERSRAVARRAASILSDLGEGIRFLATHRIVLVLLFFGLVPMFLAMPSQQLLVVFAEEVWNVGSAGFGMLQAMAGIGGAIGAFWVTRLDTRHRLHRMLLSGIAFAGLLAVFAWLPVFWPAVLVGLVAYSFAAAFGTLNSTAIQLLVPNEVRGRISSFMLMSVSLPLLGTLPVGALADARGAPFAVGVACALGAVSVVLFWAGSSSLRNLDAFIGRGPLPGIAASLSAPPCAAAAAPDADPLSVLPGPGPRADR